MKRRIQELVFKDGIIIDTKKRAFLTSKNNNIFILSSALNSMSVGENEKKRHIAVSLFKFTQTGAFVFSSGR